MGHRSDTIIQVKNLKQMIQMKSRNILIASFAALFLASSCSDVNEPDEIVKANPGDEVVFGAALPDRKSVV